MAPLLDVLTVIHRLADRSAIELCRVGLVGFREQVLDRGLVEILGEGKGLLKVVRARAGVVVRNTSGEGGRDQDRHAHPASVARLLTKRKASLRSRAARPCGRENDGGCDSGRH